MVHQIRILDSMLHYVVIFLTGDIIRDTSKRLLGDDNKLLSADKSIVLNFTAG